MKTVHSQAYFDNPEIWNPESWQQREGDQERARQAVEWLPVEVSSVLDVGCGNGVYTNQSEPNRYKVGLDMSRAALEYVFAPRLLADASHLPFEDNSFDAGVSMEMLEHLPGSIYQETLSELERISRKYILITVPYKENLKFNTVICPKCRYAFHPYNHLQRYQSQDFKTLFSPHFQLVRLDALVPIKREALPFVWNVISVYRHRQGRNFPSMAVCPQCGYRTGSTTGSDKPESLARSVNSTLKQLWPKRTTYRWWMALYRKTTKND